jgi:hypothetical protein
MTPIIIKAGIGDVETIAPLFDAYRIFYEQETDITAATNFLSERLTKNESVILLPFSMTQLLALRNYIPFFLLFH